MELGSTSVTSSAGCSAFKVRAAVAPPKPPPITTTLARLCAETTAGARPAAALIFRK